MSHELAFPIDVTSGAWELGLLELVTYNSIPNVETNVNDKFYYGQKEITIPEGAYEIGDIEKYVKSKVINEVTS
ncbi:hypothetical protein, partial [Klebsiella pneumoniae]|uniref:hypothetical protein n=1 Tax=Klebsiella pneumoniae TaxID=573 RepID=UPI001C8F8B69